MCHVCICFYRRCERRQTWLANKLSQIDCSAAKRPRRAQQLPKDFACSDEIDDLDRWLQHVPNITCDAHTKQSTKKPITTGVTSEDNAFGGNTFGDIDVAPQRTISGDIRSLLHTPREVFTAFGMHRSAQSSVRRN